MLPGAGVAARTSDGRKDVTAWQDSPSVDLVASLTASLCKLPSAGLANLDDNRDVALLRVSMGKLEHPCAKQQKPCVPAAKVVERFCSFFEDSDDESFSDEEWEDDDNVGGTEAVLGVLTQLSRAHAQQLASYMEPLVRDGAAASHDAARLASHKRGAPLAFCAC